MSISALRSLLLRFDFILLLKVWIESCLTTFILPYEGQNGTQGKHGEKSRVVKQTRLHLPALGLEPERQNHCSNQTIGPPEPCLAPFWPRLSLQKKQPPPEMLPGGGKDTVARSYAARRRRHCPASAAAVASVRRSAAGAIGFAPKPVTTTEVTPAAVALTGPWKVLAPFTSTSSRR